MSFNPEKRMKGALPRFQRAMLARKVSSEINVSVPQSDTGRRVENTKAIGRTLVKEFGKMAP